MLIPAGFAQINHYFVGGSIPTGAQVTYGVFLTDESETPTETAQNAANSWLENFLPLQVGSITLINTMAKYGPNDTGPSGTYPTASVGGVSYTAEAPMVSVLVTKNTAMGGRQGKGRMFIPGVPESLVGTGGVLGGGDVATWQAAANAFYADQNTRGNPLALLRAEGSPITTPADLTSLSVEARVATQRRRNRR